MFALGLWSSEVDQIDRWASKMVLEGRLRCCNRLPLAIRVIYIMQIVSS